MSYFTDSRKCEDKREDISFQDMSLGDYEDARFCRCRMKAGAIWVPEQYADKQVLLVFGKGTGYITDSVDAYNIDEVAFYFPNYDKTPYSVTAVSDMEIIFAVIELNNWDRDLINDTAARLPLFRTAKQCSGYTDRNSLLDGLKAYNVLVINQYGRIIIDILKSDSAGKTAMRSNDEAAQWNYFVKAAKGTVSGEDFFADSGDLIYIPAGEDRQLIGGEDGMYVIRISQFVRPYDFSRYADAPSLEEMGHISDQKIFYHDAGKTKAAYDENGYFITEMLPGSYLNGIRNFKVYLKAGCEVSPELYGDKGVLIMFGKGRGYVQSSSGIHIFDDRAAFYMPDFDHELYTIHAYEDMEYIFSVVDLSEYDQKTLNNWHVELPYYISLRDAIKYNQWCKGDGATSWWVLRPGMFGRIICGVVEARNDGTRETAHPDVEQWNYCLQGADFSVSVDDEPVIRHRAGDFSYIPAGYDHCLTASGDEYTFYVWYEHFTPKEDHFTITPVNSEYIQQATKTSADRKQ